MPIFGNFHVGPNKGYVLSYVLVVSWVAAYSETFPSRATSVGPPLCVVGGFMVSYGHVASVKGSDLCATASWVVYNCVKKVP